MPRHLLDRRLSPVRDLASRVSSALVDLGDLPADAPLIPLLTNRSR
jgi:hypothetical protein